VIRLSASSVQQSLLKPHDRRALDDVNAATTHGAAIVSQLLTFARQQPQDPKRFDVFERLRALTPLLKRVAGTDADCSIEVPTGAATVLMDPAQFEQIAINLVTNARDATAGGGRIGVQLDALTLDADASAHAGVQPGDYARLVVEDTGHGIPPEIRARIFEPFFTTKGAGHGSGLGLSMVHGIARRLGGNVVVGTAPGQGTRFEVFLPAMELGGPTPERSSRATRATPPFELTGVDR